MSLKYTTATLNDVPAPLREHYVAARDGGFQLAIEGHPDTVKLAEFRTSNVDLLKERDALKAKLVQLEAARPDAKVAELEAALATERAARTAAEATAGASVLKAAVTAAFIKMGGRPSAAEFIVSKAAEVFTVKDGAVTTSKFSPLRPGEPLSLDDFMVTQAQQHDFAFGPSSGGGAQPARVSGGPGPSSNELLDPTPQQLGKYGADIAAGRMKVRYSS